MPRAQKQCLKDELALVRVQIGVNDSGPSFAGSEEWREQVENARSSYIPPQTRLERLSRTKCPAKDCFAKRGMLLGLFDAHFGSQQD